MLSHVCLFETPWTVACQAPLVLSRQEYWSGLPCPPARDLPNPGIKPRSPTLQVESLPSEPPGKSIYATAAAAAKSLQSCPTLCDPIDGSPPGSPVPGILQARTLEWGAIAFSSLVAQLCPNLFNPTDCSLPGLFQAKILEEVDISFSRGSSRPRDQAHVS